MGQKEPIKITLSGILRWIFGLFFVVIALAMVTEREYFSAVFIFMAAFVSFPQISNLLESELNISISGPMRFLLVIILLAGSIAVEHNNSNSSSTAIYAHTSSGPIILIRMIMLAIGSGNGIRHRIQVIKRSHRDMNNRYYAAHINTI